MLGQRPAWAGDLAVDGRLLFATSDVRTFAYGFLSVMLGLYLADLGLSPTASPPLWPEAPMPYC